MTWLTLIPVFACFVLGAWCSYCKTIRDSHYYLLAFVVTCLVTSYIWVSATRALDNVGTIVLYSLCWDVLMIAAYYGLPFMMSGRAIPTTAWIGVALVVSGLLTFKLALE